MKDFPTVIPVVAAALIDRNGRVLLQQRGAGRAHEGLWEFPGGKVEPGESLVKALIRELAEELDVTLDASDLDPLTFAGGSEQAHVILLYTCRRWRGEPRCLDAAQIGWFAPAAMQNLPLVALDVPLARVLAATLETAN